MKHKSKKWHKARHTFFFWLSKCLIRIYSGIVYRYRGKKFEDKGQYLFLYNHQTPLDQHLLYLSLSRLPYTVASEDIFTMGGISRFICYAQAPIPFKKSENDFAAVKTCVRIVKEGYSIALSPEGNRTFTGETVHIKKSIVKLIKLLRLPVAFFIIRGGYGVMPRYAKKPRKGKMSGSIEKVLAYEAYKDMSDDDLYELIRQTLYVDESETSQCRSAKKAEYMENAVYLCPSCKSVGTLASKGNAIGCNRCGLKGYVNERLQFNEGFPVKNLKEWTALQNEWVNALSAEETERPIFSEIVTVRKLLRDKAVKQMLAKEAEARAYADRLEVDGKTFYYRDVSAITVCGRKRLDFYYANETIQLTASDRFCALKYVNLYYHYKNIKEDGDGFLGI